MRTTALAACLLLTACAGLPRAGKPAMTDVQFRMREFRLANGLRIIVEEDHAAPLVGVVTVVNVGSSGDPKGKEGLAHLVEHLAFRAKPNGGGTAWSQLETAGVGFLNATTDLDCTTYFEVGSKELLPKLLAIDVGRLTNPLLGVDQATFDVEREVVRNELRQRGENAIGPAFNFLQEAAFPTGHDYARPIGGSHESLSAITLEDAKAFVAAHYQPKDMTLVIIGDVDLAKVQSDLFRGLPNGFFQPLPASRDAFPARLRAEAPPLPEPPATKLLRRNSTVASPELYAVWSLPRAFDADTVLLDFVRSAANRELSAAFMSDPDIVNVSVFTVPGAQASMLVAQATLRRGDHVEKSYERLLDQLVNIWAPSDQADDANALVATDKRFGRARNAAVMQMTLEAEAIALRGVERAQSAHFTGDPLTYSRRIKALVDVNESRVTHFAEKYLTRDRARAVLVEPFPADAKRAAATTTGLAPAAPDAKRPAITADAVRALGASQQGRALETIVRAKRDHVVETLPNGLTVVVHKRRDALPVAVVQLSFRSGSAMATPVGAADLGEQLASPRARAAGNPADYGINWAQSVRRDASRVVGTGANGNVPNMLAQLAERVTSMHVETSELEFFKTEFTDYLEKAEALPIARAERALEGALFGEHPFGRTATIADQRKLSASDVERWYERAWSPRGAVLVVTGDLDAEKTMLEAKARFSGWTAPQQPIDAPPPLTAAARAEPVVLVTPQANATQAQLHLACLAPGKSDAQDVGAQVTATLLSTALFDTIRGELGASYGISGGASVLADGTARLDWGGSIENGRLGEGLGILRRMMKRFSTDVLSDRSLGRARWEVARQATLLDASTEDVAAALSAQALLGRSTEGLAKRFDVIADVDAAQVERVWSACQGSAVLSLVGDEALIRQALKTAGF